MSRALVAVAVPVLLAPLTACRDVHGFSTGTGHHYEGAVVAGNFVRAGVADATRLCLTLDTDHLQDTPGSLSTSDGAFAATPLRPIPQIWHDPLSTLQFGDGRAKNLVYMLRPAGDAGADVTAILSLMDSGNVEVRLLRGAPSGSSDDPIFAVFALDKRDGACPF